MTGFILFRLMEEEKENTEQRAEETESREGRGSLGSLHRFKSVSSLNLHPPPCMPAPACPEVGTPSPEGGSTAQPGRETSWALRLWYVSASSLPRPSRSTLVFFCLFVFSLFYPEENQVHLLAQRSKIFKTALS